MKCSQTLAMVCLVALAGLVACDSANDPVGAQLPAGSMDGQMATVAVETDQMVDEMLTDELNRMPQPATSAAVTGTVITDEITFSRTRSCPAGGELQVDGRLVRTFETDTRTMEATFTGTRSRTDCAFFRDQHVITVDGSARLDAFRRRVDGRPDGLQTASASGSWEAVRDDGETRACSFAVEVVRDPDNRTRTVSGFICGTEFTRTTTWNGD